MLCCLLERAVIRQCSYKKYYQLVVYRAVSSLFGCGYGHIGVLNGSGLEVVVGLARAQVCLYTSKKRQKERGK